MTERLSARSKELIEASRVAHLATADQYARPHIMPIVFAHEGPFVYTPIDAKPTQPLAGARPFGEPERCLVQRFAATDAEEHPTAGRQERDRGDRLRDERRVVTKRRGGHAGAKPNAGRPRCDRPQQCVGEWCVSAGVAPGMEVIAYRHAIEAKSLCEDRVIEEAFRLELLCRRFPAER